MRQEALPVSRMMDGLKWRRFVDLPTFRDVPTRLIDIPESIPQLGYGSHQFFRY